MNLKNLNKLTTNKYFIAIVFVISFLLSFSPFIFKDFFIHARGLGYLGLFLINFFASATFFISGPAFLTVIAGGGIYNPLLVAVIASLGAALGDLVSFFFGYSTRHLALAKLESYNVFEFLEKNFKKYGVWIILIFSFVPNPFFDAVGLIAGIFRFDAKKFFLLMVLGRFLRFLLLAFIGAKFY